MFRKLNFILIFTFVVLFLFSCNNDKPAIDPQALAGIPVLHEGRIKPLDTFARVSLLAFYGKSKIDKITPMEWLFEMMFEQDKAYARPVFKIRNPDTVAAYKLESNPNNVYSFKELTIGLQGTMETISQLQRMQTQDLSPAQKEILQISQALMNYYEISRSMSLILPEFRIQTDKLSRQLGLEKDKNLSYLEVYAKQRELQKIADSLLKIDVKNINAYENDVLTLGKQLQFMDSDSHSRILRIIPPQWQDDYNNWYSPWSLVLMGRGSTESAQYLEIWKNISQDYLAKNSKAYYTNVDLLKELSVHSTQDLVSPYKLHAELLYNRLDLFTMSLVFYIIAFLFLMVSWMYKPAYMRKIAYVGLIIGLILHTIGLLMRMYIMSRPPVSTLYESIIFVGFISVLASYLIERVKHNGLGILIGSVSGSALHFIGFGYAADGDSMGMLVAVLNTNFWLATHVVTITIGYGACFVVGFIGHVYLIKHYLYPDRKAELSELYKIMMGISLFALFFSMFGTILGGIWADQSWGRFWGWDPKENGALLICLWLLFMQHGRIANYYKAVGFALGMVFNNIIVAVAWFGVNLLNIGLHSYGFTDSIAWNLGLFCLAEVLFIVIMYGLIYKQNMTTIKSE